MSAATSNARRGGSAPFAFRPARSDVPSTYSMTMNGMELPPGPGVSPVS